MLTTFACRWKKYGGLARDEQNCHLLRLLCVDSYSKSSIEVINLQETWISPVTLQTMNHSLLKYDISHREGTAYAPPRHALRSCVGL